MEGWSGQLQIIGEIALAMFLGGMIGLEREMANKPAGFRTHMLIAGAATLLVALSDALLGNFRVLDTSGTIVRSDPIRIVEAVVTGVSFLGAGTIFRRSKGHFVEGLTTAASILLCAAVGIAVALGQLVLAVGTTILVLIVLRGLHFIERRFGGKAAGRAAS